MKKTTSIIIFVVVIIIIEQIIKFEKIASISTEFEFESLLVIMMAMLVGIKCIVKSLKEITEVKTMSLETMASSKLLVFCVSVCVVLLPLVRVSQHFIR